MNKIAILSVVAALATVYFLSTSSTSTELESQFQAFLTEYGRSYNSQSEYDFRMQVFKKNMENAKILGELNPEAEFGVTIFSDQTEEEMIKRMGDIPDEAIVNAKINNEVAEPNADPDWRSYQHPIQNQGSCGSCWAFAAAATVEAYNNIKTSKNPKLSEQQLVDCVTTCSGCNGGLALYAFDWGKSNEFCTLDSYKYTARQGTCQSGCTKAGVRTQGSSLLSGGEAGIIAQMNKGPVAISIDASTWSSYRGGIMTSCGQSTNHAVVVSAFHSSTGASDKAYYLVRNSWGPSWGESGHIKLAHGVNICNITRRPCIPL